jgi:hypothetical protein
MPAMVLDNGAVFGRAEDRIREYCGIEVYVDRNYKGGYDDHHNVTDSVTPDDVEAANNLYAQISSLDRERLVRNPEIPAKLAVIKDADLGGLGFEEWERMKMPIRSLLASFLSIPNVKLGKATKILHLKRPQLFPILDSYVVKFLTGVDMENNSFSTDELLQIGMNCLGIARSDLIKNQRGFSELQSRLADLPTSLTAVRLYDILCWTQEKWVNRGETSGPHGVAHRSLNQTGAPAVVPGVPQQADSAIPPKEPPAGEIHNIKEFRQIKLKAEGVIVNTGSSPPRAHRPLCRELTEERFQDAVVFNEGKKGRYYLRNNLAESVKDFGAVACMKCKPERPVVRRE